MIDFEAQARQVLPEYVAAYFSASAGDGTCLAEGIADWASFRFRPRALRSVEEIDLRTSVLGTPVSSPILVAPMAQQVAANPEAERITARAAARAGTLLGISHHTVVPFADLEAIGAPFWYQVYLLRSRELTQMLVERAEQNGAAGIIVTIDANYFPMTHADVDPRRWPESPAKQRTTNVTPEEIAAAGVGGNLTAPDTTFADIEWLHDLTDLPILVKGVLRADDAQLCVDAGASAVVVSTHGARRMGLSVTSARALPEVVAAVGDQAEVYVDSGLRNGQQVAAALAMGAHGVFIGRPVMWALAASGEDGIAAVLEQFTTELAMTMMQLGVGTVADLTPDLLTGAR